MSENLFDDYNETTEMSLEDQTAFQRDNIHILRKDLQENGHKYSAEEYEMTENYIYAIQTVVKELQNELKESMQGRFVNGVLLSETGYKGAPEVTQEKLDLILQNGNKNLNLQGCYFSKVTLQGKFENANFENSYFSDCKFENAEFINASFKNANIYGDMKGVKFSKVSFEGAGIYDSRWENTKFEQVDFLNSNWKLISTARDTVTFNNCNFLLADMNSVYIKGSKVEGKMENVSFRV